MNEFHVCCHRAASSPIKSSAYAVSVVFNWPLHKWKFQCERMHSPQHSIVLTELTCRLQGWGCDHTVLVASLVKELPEHGFLRDSAISRRYSKAWSHCHLQFYHIDNTFHKSASLHERRKIIAQYILCLCEFPESNLALMNSGNLSVRHEQ